MADSAVLTSEAAEEERLMLDALGSGLSRRSNPSQWNSEHANEYPDRTG